MKVLRRALCFIALVLLHLQYAKAACDTITNLTVTAVTCDSVKFTWKHNAAYKFIEYSIDAMPTSMGIWLSTTALPNEIKHPGLKANVWYFIHIKAQCGPSDPSGVVNFPFKTAKCPAPTVINIKPGSNDVTIKWQKLGCAIGYDYAIDSSATPPSTGFTATTADSFVVTGLKSKTKYYVHLRSRCDSAGGFVVHSPWNVSQSFNTPAVGISSAKHSVAELLVYPNPVGDMVHAELPGSTAANGKVQLLSVEGRILETMQMQSNTASFNTSTLSTGIYFVQYSDETGLRQTVKVCK